MSRPGKIGRDFFSLHSLLEFTEPCCRFVAFHGTFDPMQPSTIMIMKDPSYNDGDQTHSMEEEAMKLLLHSASKRHLMLLIAGAFILGLGETLPAQTKTRSSKPWLGVSLQDVNQSIAKKNKLKEELGAYVSDVTQKSPADSAGIEEGDVIVEFSGRQIDDSEDLVSAVGKSKVGEKVKIVVVRKGEKKTLQATLAKLPRSRSFAFSVPPMRNMIRIFSSHNSQGMQLMELNEQLGEYFGAPNGTGVLVEKVEKESSAEKAGIKAGDVLVKVGSRMIDEIKDVTKAFSKLDEGDKVDIVVLRKGTQKTMSMEMDESNESSFFRVGPEGTDSEPMVHPQGLRERLDFHFDQMRPEMDKLKLDLQKMTRELRTKRIQTHEQFRLAEGAEV
jgi:serine protease Do